jgi:hypothetical protein
MELICYLQPGWAPLIRPAPATRPWMDATPEAFAYRCLPLNIANAHGWEVLCPCGFEATWTGGTGTDAITIVPDESAPAERAPVSLFGQGVLTFHIEGILRTPPGWNLWISGSPNRAKDGLAPLTGVVETDWSPFTFTMNWQFTRAHHPVRFEALEPICFLFPVERALLEKIQPRLAPMAEDPALAERFAAWSRARDGFHRQMAEAPPVAPADRWQKHYYRGVDVEGRILVDDHLAKLRLRPFDRAAMPEIPEAPAHDVAMTPKPPKPPEPPPSPVAADLTARQLRKREWLLETLERQRLLSPAAATIERRVGLGREEFLDRYYAPARPLILAGEMAGWPALTRWTPAYLAETIGAETIEFQADRSVDPLFERNKDAHRREAPFDAFIELVTRPGAANDVYLTAYNSARNEAALAPLRQDLGFLDKFLSRNASHSNGMMWIGPAGTLTSLHHDLTNNLIAQLVGRKHVKLLPASEVGRLYNQTHVFSEIADLEAPDLDIARFPRLVGTRAYDVLLEPGEILFVPLGWWHQVRALDFSVTLTYTNFLWDNMAAATYPGD